MPTIEPTEKMVATYVKAWQERLSKPPQEGDRPAVRAGLAAVLEPIANDIRMLLDEHAEHIHIVAGIDRWTGEPCPSCAARARLVALFRP